jgi:hypothetical protein
LLAGSTFILHARGVGGSFHFFWNRLNLTTVRLVVSSLFLGGGLLAQLARAASSCSLALLSFYNARGVGGSFHFFWDRLNRI